MHYHFLTTYLLKDTLMPSNHLIIQDRSANNGNFLTKRILPFLDKRVVEPFVIFNETIAVSMREREHYDVLSRPHKGFFVLQDKHVRKVRLTS